MAAPEENEEQIQEATANQAAATRWAVAGVYFLSVKRCFHFTCDWLFWVHWGCFHICSSLHLLWATGKILFIAAFFGCFCSNSPHTVCCGDELVRQTKTQQPSHATFTSLIGQMGLRMYFLSWSWSELTCGKIPMKLPEVNKKRGRQHAASPVNPSPKRRSGSSCWVWLRSDHVLTTNDSLQSSFESVLRPLLQRGLCMLVWSAFGAIATITLAQTNRIRGGKKTLASFTKTTRGRCRLKSP